MHISILGSTVEIDESAITEPPDVVREQVREYERGERETFDLTVTTPENTTGAVMNAMTDIPYGETRTYGELAAELDTSPVAVGQACGRNPVPIVVPCHRVVGSDGGLRGYSGGDGIETKRRLLEFEQGTTQTRLPTES